MKVQITDPIVLSRVSPVDVTSYLRSKGSQRRGNFRDVAGVWEYNQDEIIVPNDRQLADYTYAISTILMKIAKSENRSQLEILRDIQVGGYDVVRVRNTSSEATKGSLPISDCVNFITNTKEMLLSVACSLASQKASYLSRKPQQAEDYIKSVRFGQTEIGSFVITVLSPVAPELQSTLLDIPQELPYEKKVIPALYSALETINNLAREASESQSIDPFFMSTDKGITSNLCDAIVSLNDTAVGGFIEVGFTMSINRKDCIPISPIIFDKDYTPILKEASRKIKEREPQPDQELIGFVIDCHKEPDDTIGSIKIKDMQSGVSRSISVQLEDVEYSKAVQAHDHNELVKINGTVTRQGRSYILEPTTDLFVFPKEPTSEDI